MIVEECDMGVLGQGFGQSTLVRVAVGFDKVMRKPSLGTCMVEVGRRCVILEN